MIHRLLSCLPAIPGAAEKWDRMTSDPHRPGERNATIGAARRLVQWRTVCCGWRGPTILSSGGWGPGALPTEVWRLSK